MIMVGVLLFNLLIFRDVIKLTGKKERVMNKNARKLKFMLELFTLSRNTIPLERPRHGKPVSALG